MSPEEVEDTFDEGVWHMEFVVELYRLQLDEGRHVLRERPESASSWRPPMMIKLLQHPRVQTCVSGLYVYRRVTHDSARILVPAKNLLAGLHRLNK